CSRGLCFGLRASEMVHVDLQWIAVLLVPVNQLARQFDLFLRNLVEGINFRVIDDRHIEAVVDGLVHEDAVEESTRIGVETKRNVAHAKDVVDVGNSMLNTPPRL